MIKKTRTTIPQANKVRAELQKEVGSTCPFCDSDDVGHFEIHHIDMNPSNNELRNLILLCPTCHSKITKGDIAPVQVFEKKIELLMKPKAPGKGQSISINKINNAVIGDNNKVTIKQPRKKTIEKYPEGCIGHDTVTGNYIDHLVNRYNEYKEFEVGKSNMSYGWFRSHLKKKYKIPPTRTLLNLPQNRFDELVTYIQSRIDGTMLAKTKPGHKDYSTFDDYSREMNGQ